MASDQRHPVLGGTPPKRPPVVCRRRTTMGAVLQPDDVAPKMRSLQDQSGCRQRTQDFFILPCAQRFFIASDNRFRPAAVSPRRFLVPGTVEGAAVLFGARAAGPFPPAPSNARIARSMRPLSIFNSATILFTSKA